MPIKRAMQRGCMVRIGETFLAEFTHETSLDLFCSEVENTGGIVHSITDYTSERVASDGKVRAVRRYVVVVTIGA